MSQRPYRDTHNGVSVSDFHMIYQFPQGEKGVFTWKPYVGLAFLSFTRSISFHMEKKGLSPGKPPWD